ncbi:UNVERIFIED_CONTAM: hypothetical protein Slati_0817500 [Sesamum latifolium]|uniref:Uncharacterized protein n=1 Tax=Sesamum latifolium TaxID=2727402 RepID=A0AAW2XL01_9LAMI
MSFPAPVLTPRFDLPAVFLTMTGTVHRADVDTLSLRSTPQLVFAALSSGSLFEIFQCALSYFSIFPGFLLLLLLWWKNRKRLKVVKSLREELQEMCSQVLVFRKSSKDGEVRLKEVEAKFQEGINILKAQLMEDENRAIMLTLKNDVQKNNECSSLCQRTGRGLHDWLIFCHIDI